MTRVEKFGEIKANHAMKEKGVERMEIAST